MLGTVHAAWSLYWAVGGTFLLDTVGQWAVRATREDPALAFWGLLGVTAAKLAAAWIPLLAETGCLLGRRIWRVLSWVGGAGLVLYGGANAVAAGASLLGWVDAGVVDRTALLGHAFLWDPLFAAWGLALLLGLALSRGADDPLGHPGPRRSSRTTRFRDVDLPVPRR